MRKKDYGKLPQFFFIKEGRVLRNGECQRKDGLYQYEILSQIEGESYILNSVEGKYGYNECFSPSDKKMFVHQKYEKVTPDRIIKFCDFYLMNTIEEKNIWYRGRKDVNGNWEYICYSDSLNEAFSFL